MQFLKRHLMANNAELTWLAGEMTKWKGIQSQANESQKDEEDKILKCTWSNKLPHL